MSLPGEPAWLDKGAPLLIWLSVEVLYRIVDPFALETAPDTATGLLEDLEWMIQHEVARGDLSQLIHGRELLTARLVTALVVGAPATGVDVLDVDITDVEVELSQELLRWMR